MPNGLLPPLRGARPPGDGAAPGPGPAGAPPSPNPVAGAGRGAAGRGVAMSPRSRAARTAASCSALSAAARTSAAATSMSCALVGLVTGDAGAGAGDFFAGAVFLGGAGLIPDLAPSTAGAADAAGAAVRPAASMVARSRRATGASIVLDADLTYSPIS